MTRQDKQARFLLALALFFFGNALAGMHDDGALETIGLMAAGASIILASQAFSALTEHEDADQSETGCQYEGNEFRGSVE